MVINQPKKCKWQQTNKPFSQFYPQDDGENKLA